MQRLNEIHELYSYNRWANARVLEAAGDLSEDQLIRDLGSSFPSIRDTLAHVIAAEWIWLSRWRRVSPRGVPEGWIGSGYEGLRARWREVEEDQRAFLDDLTEEALNEVVAYANTAGKPFETPLWQMLRHVVNHSTYHRGQVVTMLRQLGAEAPSTDLILFYRSGGGAG